MNRSRANGCLPTILSPNFQRCCEGTKKEELSSRLEGFRKEGRVAARGERIHTAQGMRTQRSPWLMICLKGESLGKRNKAIGSHSYLLPVNCPPKLTHLIVPIYNHIPDKPHLSQINFQWRMSTSRSFLNDHCKSLWFTNNWVFLNILVGIRFSWG